MEKALRILGTEEKFLNLLNVTYEKATADVTLSGED
jgi:hypothetical protein